MASASWQHELFLFSLPLFYNQLVIHNGTKMPLHMTLESPGDFYPPVMQEAGRYVPRGDWIDLFRSQGGERIHRCLVLFCMP